MRFAKNEASPAKKLNIAVQSLSHEKVQTFLISFPALKEVPAIVNFFLRLQLLHFLAQISWMRFKLVEPAQVSLID